MIKFDKKLKPGLTLLEKIGVVVQRSQCFVAETKSSTLIYRVMYESHCP